MKFALASLIATAAAQEQVLATSSTGALNYHWTERYHCPDFATGSGPIEDISSSSAQPSMIEDMTFEDWAQHCAELSYGLSAEYAPCI